MKAEHLQINSRLSAYRILEIVVLKNGIAPTGGDFRSFSDQGLQREIE